MYLYLYLYYAGVCVWAQMKHLNKGRTSHSSTQAPLRPLGPWCRRSRAVERQTLRSGRIVRWGNIPGPYCRMCKWDDKCTLMMLKVKLGLAAVAIVPVRCVWQLAASFLGCHFYFLWESHLTVRQTHTFTHKHTQTHTHIHRPQYPTQHHTAADLFRHRMWFVGNRQVWCVTTQRHITAEFIRLFSLYTWEEHCLLWLLKCLLYKLFYV